VLISVIAMPERLFSLLILVALCTGISAVAGDDASAIVEQVVKDARDTMTWEAEGRLTTRNAGTLESKAEVPFRVSLEYARGELAKQRARLEVLGGPRPLVRVCDGQIQWTYLVVPRQFWKLPEPRIDDCIYPFNEWANLATDLHSPLIVGKETLTVYEKKIKCTVVKGDFGAQEPASVGSRTLWIDEASRRIWQYRIEVIGDRSSGISPRVVETYAFLANARRHAPSLELVSVPGSRRCDRSSSPNSRFGKRCPATNGNANRPAHESVPYWRQS
jgi:hypothetical protein